MATSNEPQNEAVRVDLPLPVAGNSSNLKIEETVRVPPVANQPASHLKSNQSNISMTNVAPQSLVGAVAPRQKESRLLLWILLGVSALILIIQIWTYLS